MPTRRIYITLIEEAQGRFAWRSCFFTALGRGVNSIGSGWVRSPFRPFARSADAGVPTGQVAVVPMRMGRRPAADAV
jgi:hypothetical protein